jgi:hypothetical protein
MGKDIHSILIENGKVKIADFFLDFLADKRLHLRQLKGPLHQIDRATICTFP